MSSKRWLILLGLLAAATAVIAASDSRHAGSSPTRAEDAGLRALELVVADDPRATGRALRGAGYDIQWKLVTSRERGEGSATEGRSVGGPPPGTRVLSITDAEGGALISARTTTITIEVTPVGRRGVPGDHLTAPAPPPPDGTSERPLLPLAPGSRSTGS